MSTERFWATVDAARAKASLGFPSDPEEVAHWLTLELVKLPADEIVQFQVKLEQIQTTDLKLWAAAYLVNGSASTDGFTYFLGWLIAQGRTVWDTVLAEPDSLGDILHPDHIEEELNGEAMLGAASMAFAARGNRIADFGAAIVQHQPAPSAAPTPIDNIFDFEDSSEMRRLLPRLAELFL